MISGQSLGHVICDCDQVTLGQILDPVTCEVGQVTSDQSLGHVICECGQVLIVFARVTFDPDYDHAVLNFAHEVPDSCHTNVQGLGHVPFDTSRGLFGQELRHMVYDNNHKTVLELVLALD